MMPVSLQVLIRQERMIFRIPLILKSENTAEDSSVTLENLREQCMWEILTV